MCFASGARAEYGRGGPALAIRFTHTAAERALLGDPALALGELYADGSLVLEQGDLYELVACFKRNQTALLTPSAALLHGMRYARSLRPERLSLADSARNVAHHYDLDAAFYRLFLDVDMQYSCAYFEHAAQSLDAAQLAKKRHLAGKLLLSPGQRVLDIGCGYGGLGLYLAEVAGADVHGITLSEPQRALAEQRARARGLADAARFTLTDYRRLDARFDRIVSVGMFEHVGKAHYREFFARCAQLLAPDGVCVVHSIGRTRPRAVPSPFVDKYVFPGSYIPALSEVLPAVERAGFLVTDVELLPLHYADTLRAWRTRFVARRAEVLAMYDERLFRLWEFYLAAAETGFRMDRMFVFQLQLTRPQHVVPRTRDYLAERKGALRARERACAEYAAIAD